jgi:hypothetical protein
MSNYENGKIYKLTSPNTDMIYIGSTIQSLNRRFNSHKIDINKGKGITSFNMFIWNDAKIQLIERYECNSKKELVLREQYYIELYSDYCVNFRKAYQTEKQRKVYNKKYKQTEKYKETEKKYKQTNIEKIKTKNKVYREINKDKIRQSTKIYEETNQDRLKQRRKELYIKNKKNVSKKNKKWRLENIEQVKAMKKRYNDYINSMGGNYRYNNNLTRIDPTLFS